MRRLLTIALLPLFVVIVCNAPAADAPDKVVKTSLQELNDFVGSWNGDGKSTGLKKESWAETLEWGWNFKGEVKMVLKIKGGKYFKTGDLTYLADKKTYQLTLVDAQDEKHVFTGNKEKDYLVLDSVDPKTKETQRLKINLAGDGVRLQVAASKKGDGKTLFSPQYTVSYSMEGASLGAKAKKQECIVSGGLGTQTISYKGQTYYICCSGCRDAFNDNPEKYVKEWEAKKGKK